ncbi:methyltransferase domain-containing protein [Streptomyces sp. NBC_00090]|uniref:methyltransferase domain-containing protein n=1 Tax=Streptomyces sp. NBC_00090 TaxID=2903619 RepID=UPI00386AFADC
MKAASSRAAPSPATDARRGRDEGSPAHAVRVRLVRGADGREVTQRSHPNSLYGRPAWIPGPGRRLLDGRDDVPDRRGRVPGDRGGPVCRRARRRRVPKAFRPELAERVRFLKAGVENLDVGDERFGLVCCHRVLMCLEELDGPVARLAGLVAAGGVLSIPTKGRPPGSAPVRPCAASAQWHATSSREAPA